MSEETRNQANFDDQDVQNSDQAQLTEESHLLPLSSLWRTIGFYLFLLAWAGYMLYETLSYTNFEDYALPYMMTGLLVVLIPLKIFTLLYPDLTERLMLQGSESDVSDHVKSQVENQMSHSTRSKAEQEKYELLMIGWVVVLPFMMYWIGMGWTLLIYVFAFTWFFTRNLRLAATTTIGVTAFIVILFMYVLDMIIWTGVFGFPDPLVYLEDLLENFLS